MISLLILVVPTITYALGIFPTISLWFLVCLCALVGAIRYFYLSVIFAGVAKASPIMEMDVIRTQWVYNFASVAASFALFHSGFFILAVFFGVSTIFSSSFLAKTTYQTVYGKKVDETEEDA